MGVVQYIALVLCVAGIAVGQILFKLASQALGSGTNLWALISSPYLIGGGALYVAATFTWIWLLSRVELSQAYPFMALSFVMVPLLSMAFLGEEVSYRYWLGIALIVVGIVLTLGATPRT